jgi:hypothetical protein
VSPASQENFYFKEHTLSASSLLSPSWKKVLNAQFLKIIKESVLQRKHTNVETVVIPSAIAQTLENIRESTLERSHTNMRNVANHLSLALTCPASKIFI